MSQESDKQVQEKLAKMKIRDGLETTKTLVDVHWREDVMIKTKNREHATELRYVVDLKTEEKSPISFICTLHGLQDLVFKLRECRKSIENTYNLEP